MKYAVRIVSALLFLGAANAQTYGLLGSFAPQFFDNNGNPLAGGKIYTCLSGSPCPGTPQTTFSDASGFSANANPIILDSSGRPSNGSSPVSIFGPTTQQYKIVVMNSSSVVISTTDNVSPTSGSSGATTNYWTLTGSDIANNNGAGAGNVNVGAGLGVAGTITLTGALKMRDGQSSPHYASLRANSTMAADVTWRWPALDAIGVLQSDGVGNLSFVPGGGGGGGTPGGANTNVQFNNSAAFGGSGNFTWNNSGQLLTVTASGALAAGIAVGAGYVQADAGFLATPGTCVFFNCIQAPGGGMSAKSFTALNYIQAGNHSGTPTATTSDTFVAGALYWDTGATAMKVFNGSSWITLATGGATSPGGANTQVQFNSAGSFGGSAAFTFASQLLSVTAASSSVAGIAVGAGYIQADAGFLATPGTAITYNAINAPGGGLFGKSLSALNYTQTGNSSGIPPLTSLDSFHAGAMYWDITLGAQRVFNGSAWVSLGAGGGSGTPGGPTTAVQFNSGGAFGGSSSFTWNDSSKLLAITTPSATAGVVVANGYIQADAGFLATPATATTYNAIQAPAGGVLGRSLSATNYVQTGNASGVPFLTTLDSFHAGAMYFDTSIGSERVFNGSSWVNLATGGIPSLNGLTGALAIAGTFNEITVSPSGSTILLSTPQQIATSSAVNFASVTTTGVLNSTASGASLAFQGGGGTFQVNGAGTISALNLLINGGSGNGVNVTSNTDANSIQTRGGVNACSAGSCSGSVAMEVNGGVVINSAGVYVGAISTPLFANSVLRIGPSGNFYTRTVAGASTGISCGGIGDGWLAVTSDNFVVVCQGGSRFRAALASF